jgi:hypothetical protein
LRAPDVGRRAAALRRLTLKIELLELGVAPRWSLFSSEAGLAEAASPQ